MKNVAIKSSEDGKLIIEVDVTKTFGPSTGAGQNKRGGKKMKQKWEITVSGGCPTFRGPELLAVTYGSYDEAWEKRTRIEKKTGRIAYLALADNQVDGAVSR